MKTRIIRLTIGLTALVASFLPQKAAACVADCPKGKCYANWFCTCSDSGRPICIDA